MIRNSFPFTTEQVLHLLSLKGKLLGNEYYIHCPLPGCSDKSEHLCVNRIDGRVYCHKCSFSGNILTLYSVLTGLSTKDAYEDILIRTGLKEEGKKRIWELKRRNEKILKEYAESPIVDVHNLDKVYNAFLDCLTLDEGHMTDLFERGFEEYFIYLKKYRSTPSKNELEKIAATLLSKGLDLNGVPGFYKKDNGHWSFVFLKRGILVPVRSKENKIQGLQCRIDDEWRNVYKKSGSNRRALSRKESLVFSAISEKEYGISKGLLKKKFPDIDVETIIKDLKAEKWVGVEAKYKWVSSQGFPSGSGTQGFIHFACDFVKDGEKYTPYIKTPQMGLTEGPMKADLTFQLTGTPLMAIPGVSNRKKLPHILKEVKELGTQQILVALDMDYLTNESVKKACDEINQMIKNAGLKCVRCKWDSRFKGIDDYYAFKLKKIKR